VATHAIIIPNVGGAFVFPHHRSVRLVACIPTPLYRSFDGVHVHATIMCFLSFWFPPIPFRFSGAANIWHRHFFSFKFHTNLIEQTAFFHSNLHTNIIEQMTFFHSNLHTYYICLQFGRCYLARDVSGMLLLASSARNSVGST
jgi:hypothetical protein